MVTRETVEWKVVGGVWKPVFKYEEINNPLVVTKKARKSSSLKDAIAERADTIAAETHGKGFYELPEEIQTQVWRQAEADYFDDLSDIAESRLEKAKKKNPKQSQQKKPSGEETTKETQFTAEELERAMTAAVSGGFDVKKIPGGFKVIGTDESFKQESYIGVSPEGAHVKWIAYEQEDEGAPFTKIGEYERVVPATIEDIVNALTDEPTTHFDETTKDVSLIPSYAAGEWTEKQDLPKVAEETARITAEMQEQAKALSDAASEKNVPAAQAANARLAELSDELTRQREEATRVMEELARVVGE